MRETPLPLAPELWATVPALVQAPLLDSHLVFGRVVVSQMNPPVPPYGQPQQQGKARNGCQHDLLYWRVRVGRLDQQPSPNHAQ